jgi:glycosyltransferase involved in cell wall biosynthesis
MTISIVINTLNAEKHLEKVLQSVKCFDEIIVCDMYSEDRTIEIAQKFNCKILYHEKTGYVEPARNFAISKTNGDWIFVVDADEVIPAQLSEFLIKFSNEQEGNGFVYTTVGIPRKNSFFGKFVKGDWWPDTQMRFFKKGCVTWSDGIHNFPEVKGQVYLISPDNEELAMLHYQCDSISDLVDKTNKYTDYEIKKHFNSKVNIGKIIIKPLGVFLRMYFRQGGYKDGLHGFILAFIRGALYRFLLLVKVWEYQNFNK